MDRLLSIGWPRVSGAVPVLRGHDLTPVSRWQPRRWDLRWRWGRPEMKSVIDVMVRSTKRKVWLFCTLTLALTVAACSTTSAPATTTTPVNDSGWVKDTVQVLNIYLPDGNSDDYLAGFGTKDGARTVISGVVPTARYWSYTAYPIPAGGPVAHVHDSNIARSNGRYTVVISATCTGVKGTCLATSNAEPSGMVVLRLYVPVDLSGSGTGGVPLPTITYESRSGSPISLTQAAGSDTMEKTLDSYHHQHGALPDSLTRTYPPDAPVPVPVVDPPPRGRISSGTGQFNNPDNIYEHVRFTTTRGRPCGLCPGTDIPRGLVHAGQQPEPTSIRIPAGPILESVHRVEGPPYRSLPS